MIHHNSIVIALSLILVVLALQALRLLPVRVYAQVCGGTTTCSTTTYIPTQDSCNDWFCNSPIVSYQNSACQANGGACGYCVANDQTCTLLYDGTTRADHLCPGDPIANANTLYAYSYDQTYVPQTVQHGCSQVDVKWCGSCTAPPACNGGATCGGWSACTGAPTNTCNSNNGSQSQTCTYTTNNGSTYCTQNSYTNSQSCTIDNCSSGFACTSGSCTTSVHDWVYVDYTHNPNGGGTTPYQGAFVSDNGGNNVATDSNGEVTYTGKTPGTVQMTLTVPATYAESATNPATNPLSTTISYTMTSSTPNPNLYWNITPLYILSGVVYNDMNKNNVADSGEGLNGWSVKLTGNGINVTTTTATLNGVAGSYTFANLEAGPYTVTLTQPLPAGYSYITPSSWSVTLGNPAGPAGYQCGGGGSASAQCGGQNSGSLSSLNFSVTNENSFTQGMCSDLRYNSGYSQLLPATASCNGTSGPYAIVQNPLLCPTDPGILFSGSTNPQYGTGLGASSSQLVVGDSLFPQPFTSRIPNTVSSSYSFVSTTLNNLASPPTPLTAICPDLTNCVLSENTPGGVYTTSAADGPVSLSVSNTDGTAQLGPQNYTFVLDGDLTFASKLTLQAASSAVFVSAGDIHIAGSVGETDWTSTAPDLEGFYSSDHNVYIDALFSPGNQCLANGQPKEKKLNIQGSVIANAANAGGGLINNRDGCVQDLSCPTITYQPAPLQILHAPGPLKPPYTLWQELNP